MVMVAVSVPAGWREQEQLAQPSYHQSELATNLQPIAERSTSMQYNNMYVKISEVPVLYHCKICGKTVSNRWHHSAIHKPQCNRCPMCKQTFTRKDNMKAHIRVKHSVHLTEIVPEMIKNIEDSIG